MTGAFFIFASMLYISWDLVVFVTRRKWRASALPLLILVSGAVALIQAAYRVTP